jgi:hypothetical protein
MNEKKQNNRAATNKRSDQKTKTKKQIKPNTVAIKKEKETNKNKEDDPRNLHLSTDDHFAVETG